MNKREIIIVVSVSILLIFTFLLVAFFSSGGGSPIKEKSTQKRFSAAPGKTRDKPLLLVSNKRDNTFGDSEEEKSGETAQIDKVYSSRLGKNDEETTGDSQGEKTKEGQVQVEMPDELKQLFSSEANNNEQSAKNVIEETLNKWVDSVQSQEQKLEILRDHLDSLISKGLTDWVTKKLEELTTQNQENKTVLSETQWLLAEIKSIQGDIATAEQYYQQAWENISTLNNLNDPKQEELFRLLGLNYVQFLRKQNKTAEAETVTNAVSEKLKRKTVSKD